MPRAGTGCWKSAGEGQGKGIGWGMAGQEKTGTLGRW